MRVSNNVKITGNLGGAVEIYHSEKGLELAKLRVAENVYRKDSKSGGFECIHTNWISVTVFGKLALRVHQGLKKGDRITVCGVIKTNTYEKDGEKKSGFEVIASSVDHVIPFVKDDMPNFEEFDGGVHA